MNLDSSPKASTPKCSQTAGQNCSLHETKSSSRLKDKMTWMKGSCYLRCSEPLNNKRNLCCHVVIRSLTCHHRLLTQGQRYAWPQVLPAFYQHIFPLH